MQLWNWCSLPPSMPSFFWWKIDSYKQHSEQHSEHRQQYFELNDSRLSKMLLFGNSSSSNTKNASILIPQSNISSRLRDFKSFFLTLVSFSYSCTADLFTSYYFLFISAFFFKFSLFHWAISYYHWHNI